MKLVLIILTILVATTILAVEFHGGEGFSGVSKIESFDSYWKRSIEKIPGFPSGGIRIGSKVFVFSRDFGFSVIDAETSEILAQLDTFHAEDLAMRIETLDLFIADGINGVLVYKYLAPWLIKLKQQIFLRGWTNRIGVWKNYVVAGTLLDGVILLKDTGEGYKEISRYGSRNIAKFDMGIGVNGMAVSDGYIYLATVSTGIIILKIENDELIETTRLAAPYAVDIAVKNDLVAISHPVDKRVSIHSKKQDYKIISELFYKKQPRYVDFYQDWDTGDEYLVTSFDSSGIVVTNLSKPEEPVQLGGYYYGLVKNWK